MSGYGMTCTVAFVAGAAYATDPLLATVLILVLAFRASWAKDPA